MNQFFNTGGVFARRRKDVSIHLLVSCLYSTFRKLFVLFCHLPDHHDVLPLLWFIVVGYPFIKLSRILYSRGSSRLIVVFDET